MRLLAEFVIKSRSRAIGSATAAAFLPVLSIFSGAILALVWLRMGRREGLLVLFWACLPGVYFLVTQNNPDVLFSLLAAGLFAEILRSTQQWFYVLMAGVIAACLVALGFQWLPEEIRTEFIRMLVQEGGVIETAELTADQQQEFERIFAQLLNGMITAVQLLLIFISLFLGRWWQAVLYNPGGFQKEFHELRLPLWYVGLTLVILILASLNMNFLLPVVPVVMVPLVLTGLSLAHAVVAIKRYNSFWLGMLYVLLLFALPYLGVLLVLIAMADSLMNFRHRLAPPSPPSDGDGEA
ncbi:hypothetical protein [Marinospirillum perlucidum]|uniref:hypothetical protein n=1 Tax=Marinospirillum perlucidum TaxID=1982602 RepID=UPI000DF26B72|nr:hypothetical protein [Marinospirillum perlucidum]